MKNLNARNKKLLAIAGIVIVVLVVGLVILVPDTAGLFGADVIHISPENPAVLKDGRLGLSINSAFICKWSTNNQWVGEILDDAPGGSKSITLYGFYPGTATIKADCAIGNRYATAKVRWPVQIIPNAASVTVGQSVQLTSANDSCQWSASSAGVSLSSLVDGAVSVTGKVVGDVTVRATCDVGSASAVVHVVTGAPVMIRSVPVITPATATTAKWGKVTLSTGDATCTWMANSAYLSPDTSTTGPTITYTAPNWLGPTLVYAKCASGWAKPATVTVQ